MKVWELCNSTQAKSKAEKNGTFDKMESNFLMHGTKTKEDEKGVTSQWKRVIDLIATIETEINKSVVGRR